MISPQVGILPPQTNNKTQRLHVVHLIEALGPGGAERLLYTNLKHFDPERIRSTVITVYPHATHWLEPITALGVPVVPLNCNNAREIPKGIGRLRTWLRAQQTRSDSQSLVGRQHHRPRRGTPDRHAGDQLYS